MSRPAFSLRRLFRRALVLTHRFVFGTLLVSVICVGLIVYGGLTWAKHKLASGWTFGAVTVTALGLKTGWDLSLRADSLWVQGPGLMAKGQKMRLRPVLSSQSLAVYPALRLSLADLTLSLAPSKDTSSGGVPAFPELRWPMPWRVEVARFSLRLSDRDLAQALDVQLSSRGLLGINGKMTVLPGSSLNNLPAPLLAGMKCEFLSRWKGKYLGYRLLLRTSAGDSLRLIGRRARKDLRQADDSLSLGVLKPAVYLPDSLAPHIPPIRDFSLQANLQTLRRLSYALQVKLHADTILLAGPIDLQVNAHGGLNRVWLRVNASKPGGNLEVTGEMPFRARQDLDSGLSALFRLRPAKASFAALSQGVTLHVGNRIIPANAVLQQGVWVPGQVMTGELITREGSKVQIAFYPRKDWLLAVDGDIAPREPWAHAWTDTHVVYQSARVRGQVKQALVQAQATFKNVTAYGAAADSVQCWNTVTSEHYRLDSTRISLEGRTWQGNGQVTWKKKGRELPHGVELHFHLAHPEFGKAFFSMPQPEVIDARCEQLAPHLAPYPPLFFLRPYNPRATGTFHWNLLAMTGQGDLRANMEKAGETVLATLRGDWDSQTLRVQEARLKGDALDAEAAAQVDLRGQPFYEVRFARFDDVRAVRFKTEGIDVPLWLNRFGWNTALQKGIFAGDLRYSPDSGMQGDADLRHLALKDQPSHMSWGNLRASGRGDTLALSLASRSQTEPLFNAHADLRILRLFSAVPDFLLDATVKDSLHLAARATLNRDKVLRGAVDLMGSVDLPAQAGSLRKLHLLTPFSLPLTGEGLSGLSGAARILEGVYLPKDLPAQQFSGRLNAEAGRVQLDSLIIKGVDGQKLEAEASYDFAKANLDFKAQGETFALNLGGQFSLRLQQARVAGDLTKGNLRVGANASAADFNYRQGAVLARGRLENTTFDFAMPTKDERFMAAPASVKLKGTLVNSLFRHQIGAEELRAFWRGLMRRDRDKGKGGGASAASGTAAAKSKPMELSLQIDTRGPNNRLETEICKLNFAGDVSVKGIQPYLLLNGAVTSLSGEIGQSSQAYDLRDLELKWQNATPEEGVITLEGDKKLKSDCDPLTQKTCHVTIHVDGRLDETRFSYETDCGGEDGEAIKPTAIINSVSRGCYSGDLTGGDNQGDYGKTLVNFITPVVNDRLTKIVKRGTFGWIRSAQVTGVSALVGGENAQSELEEAVALNLESKEKYRMRVLGSAGYFPASKQASPYDFKIAGEWRPPTEVLVRDSVWKGRLKDRLTVQAGVETRPEERNADAERQVRKQVGLRYKYQFWKFW